MTPSETTACNMPSTKLFFVGLALLVAAVTARDLLDEPERRGKANDRIELYQTVNIRGSEDGKGALRFAVIGGACQGTFGWVCGSRCDTLISRATQAIEEVKSLMQTSGTYLTSRSVDSCLKGRVR